MSHIKLSKIFHIINDFLKGDMAAEENDLKGFFEFLKESENQGLALIDLALNDTKPADSILKQGSIEAGFLLYWIHYPPRDLRRLIEKSIILKNLFKGLLKLAPATRISEDDYHATMKIIDNGGVPWSDGTLIGTERYEQLDPLWMVSSLNYAVNLLAPDTIVDFPNNTPYSSSLSRKDKRSGKNPTLGIVGDWGTGLYVDHNGANSCPNSPSQRVMNDIKANEDIDYLMHLGDVYYAGTDYRPLPFEEWENFTALWPDQGDGRNFTLNSNHEMYGDGSGYFEVALHKKGDFKHQNGMSYFSLTHGKWLVLGLDSGYYSDAENGIKLYMEGAIGTDEFSQQIDWLKSFKDHKGPIMIMTHHDPCSFTGDVHGNTLWQQVTDAIGVPAVWYYGHVHNGVVYKQLKDGGSSSSIQTKTRCCGHGAVPFGNAWQIESNVEYYAHTPDPIMGAPRVLNGYATVTLKEDGGFHEKFFETGNSTAVYSKDWAANELM